MVIRLEEGVCIGYRYHEEMHPCIILDMHIIKIGRYSSMHLVRQHNNTRFDNLNW